MFEFMKDYKTFREQIREVKVEQFNELKGLLDENQELKRHLADVEAKHERDVMNLTHQLTLERERFKLEMERKETQQVKDLSEKRTAFLEKQLSDLERVAGQRHKMVMDVLYAAVSRISDQRLQLNGPKEASTQQVDTKSGESKKED